MSPCRLIGIAAVAALASGCASVTSVAGAHYQSISVQAREQDQREVTGAICELSNKTRKWFLTTPGSVMISRSSDDLRVTCTKPQHEPGSAIVVSDIKPAMFGNILVGGVIGAIADHSDGSAYEYPELVRISMGESIRIEPPRVADHATHQKDGTSLASAAQDTPPQRNSLSYASYTLLPSGAVIADAPEMKAESKAVAVKALASMASYRKKRGDACDAYIAKGDHCWWSPPGNYSMCPLSNSLNACTAAFGSGCQLGHGKVIPVC